MIETTLGPYRILEKLGEGGMGEVYRARDTKLDRDVALKILPPAVASDPDRLMRFEREAKALAALNHPNIAQVYGLEDRAIVMELVEGDDLSELIGRGALPLAEAIEIARQVASALEAAHEAGFIHRDLKPANIKVRADGTVKVLDFGLAKAMDSGTSGPQDIRTSGRQRASAGDAATVTSPALTAIGLILGTAAYMAPEQAKGRPVDKRADIWAFGCVLYEMLTGRRLFEAEDVSETLAAVLTRDVSVAAMPATLPTGLRSLLGDCLVRDPRQRLRDMGDARLALDKMDRTPGPGAIEATPATKARWAWPAVAAVATLVAAAMTALYVTQPVPDARDLATFELTPHLPSTVGRESISPDGRSLVYATPGSGGEPSRYWLRPLGSLEARPIAGAEGFRAVAIGKTVNPIWSPDSTSLALVFGSELRRVNVVTGQSTPIIDYGVRGGGLLPGGWNQSGTILYGRPDGIWQVADTGGTPHQVTALAAGQIRHLPAGFLPDGRRFLYLVEAPNGSSVRIGSIDVSPDAQETSALVASDGRPVHVGGHLFFFNGENLMVQSFDARRGVLDGAAAQVLSAVASPVTVSNTGVLLYRPASADAGVPSELVHVDRTGTVLDTIGPAGDYAGVYVFDEGRRFVVSRKDGRGPFHVYVVERARQVFTRLTPGSDEDVAGVPSVDDTVAYTSPSAADAGAISVRAANGVGDPTPLVTSIYPAHPNGWSPDGRFLLYDSHVPGRAQDLMIVGRDGREPVALLDSAADESLGQFSPNGRWIAYRSNEASRNEIYVRDFVADPAPAFGTRRAQISVNGGTGPRWSQDGKSLFYLEEATLMQVSIDTETAGSVEVGSPNRLFDIRLKAAVPYDVLPDGTFIMNRRVETAQAPATPLRIIQNWPALLRR